jgi:hypothetical protein
VPPEHQSNFLSLAEEKELVNQPHGFTGCASVLDNRTGAGDTDFIMKISYQSTWLKMAAVMVALTFGVRAYAEGPREEIVHAYRLMKAADHDYDGHREAALKDLREAGDKLGLTLEGEGVHEERQWKSDRRMNEARRLLREARGKLEDRDRERAADKVDHAIKELDAALKVR